MDEAAEHENDLAKQAQQNNVDAFTQLYDATYDKVYSYLARRCQQPELAQDLTAETYFKALKGLSKFQLRSGIPFMAWLYRIASNELNMYFRQQHKYRFVELEHHPEVAALKTVPNYEIRLDQEQAVIQKALQRLKSIDQTIVALHFFEEKTVTEIADLLNQREGTIRVRLSRALKKMRTQLQYNGYDSII